MKKTKRFTNQMKWCGLFLTLALFFQITATSCVESPPENSRQAQAVRGKAIYDEHCASCHGEEGRGDGPEAKNLETVPSDLTNLQVRWRMREFPIVEVARIIDGRNHLEAHGPREMPKWGEVFANEEELTEDQIRGKMGELIAYLMSIQEGI